MITDRTKTSVRGRTILAAVMAVATIGLAGAANAYVAQDPVDLQVIDRETGQVLRTWRHHGRQYIAGRPGARYGLRVTNHTRGRVLVVLSVDGVNILTGETADYGQRGYIFQPRESYDLNGWRKSDTEVAAFAFARMSQSYAARTGRPGDVGVIGMAVFKERVPVPPPYYPEASARKAPSYDRSRRGSLSPAPAAPSMAPSSESLSRAAPPPPADAEDQSQGIVASRRQDEKLGTAHGAREWSAITIVPFERATSYPQSTRQIEYDTYAHLVAAGVIPTRTYPDHRSPRPFPANPDGGGYVPDPPTDPWDDPDS
jgi:hypothetical protein